MNITICTPAYILTTLSQYLVHHDLELYRKAHFGGCIGLYSHRIIVSLWQVAVDLDFRHDTKACEYSPCATCYNIQPC